MTVDLPARMERLGRRLRTPATTVDQDRALRGWEWVEISIAAQRPPLFEEVPDLPDRIRGAWGRALERRARMPATESWLPDWATAWEVFFGPPIKAGSATAPRPYIIETDLEAGRIVVRLRLVGFPANWAAEGEIALREALLRGIAIKQRGRQRLRFTEPFEARTEWKRVVRPPPPGADHLRIHLLTPLAIRRGTTVALSLDTLAVNLHNRLAGLARWQDMALQPSAIHLKAAMAALTVAQSDLVQNGWPRHSSSRDMPVSGVTGTVTLAGDFAAVGHLLEFGRLFHAGSGAALGLGRMELVWY